MTLQNILIPHVVEQSGHGEREYDIFSRLLKDRIIFIGRSIDDITANVVVAQMLFLQMENKTQDINLYINSPGGSVTAGLAIYDTMQFVQCDVATYCIGQAASMGAILLAAGTHGKRYALPHARVMIHQPWGGISGSAADLKIHADEIIHLKKRLIGILARHTKRSPEEVGHSSEREKFFTAQEARDFGIVDEVVTTLKENKPTSAQSH